MQHGHVKGADGHSHKSAGHPSAETSSAHPSSLHQPSLHRPGLTADEQLLASYASLLQQEEGESPAGQVAGERGSGTPEADSSAAGEPGEGPEERPEDSSAEGTEAPGEAHGPQAGGHAADGQAEHPSSASRPHPASGHGAAHPHLAHPHHVAHPHAPPHAHPHHKRRKGFRLLSWQGIAVGLLAGVVAFVGGIWLASRLLSVGPARTVAADSHDLAPVVYQACQENMPRINCGCFWEKSHSVFTSSNVAGILQALGERDKFGPALTRGRLENVAGEEATRQLGRALYDCVSM